MTFNLKVENVDEETFELTVFDDDDGSHSLVSKTIKEYIVYMTRLTHLFVSL